MILAPTSMRELAERAARPDFTRLEAQLRSTGCCARPVRLRGQIEACDGHGRRRVWSTDTEPDGVLRKACGNRREAVCPQCAERYRQDAYQLIAAGLRGGKGVPETVAEHAAVYVTLTAPGFGPVQAQRVTGDGRAVPCRARRDAPVCPHGNTLSCGVRHGDNDPRLGEPICPDCFDYLAAVKWNNTLGQLWRYTTIYVPRAMARLAGMTQKQLKRQVRITYVKVAEYQRRGLVHVHVLARLDRAMSTYRRHEIHPPPARFTVELLEQAIREAVADVDAPVLEALGGGRVRWGRQLDTRPLPTGPARMEVAGFMAKYATKRTEQAGGLLHRVDEHQIEVVPVREHVRRYLRTAFELHAQAAERRTRSRGIEPIPTLDIETNWNPAALAIRARRGMGINERLRIRTRRGDVHTGRATRLLDTAPARGDTTLAVELDDAICVHVGDVASIGPATKRRSPRRDRNNPRLAACAHAFGYRGHCMTKSRRYSTTMKALADARQAFIQAQILARSRDATQRAIAGATTDQRTASFRYVGTGHVTAADALLAASAAARARENRQLAREAWREREMAFESGGTT